MAGSSGLGSWGEDLAVNFLQEKGLTIIARNLQSSLGECDILASEQDQLIFVEVKTRSSSIYGPPELAVTREKRDHLRRLARAELRNRDFNHCRFDVIAIEVDFPETKIRHIVNAFTALE